MRALIVGQGIAGVVLAWTLEQKGMLVNVAEAGFDGAASRMAAGIINPITGKRFVKSWRFDEAFAFAKSFWQSAGDRFQAAFWTDASIIRLLGSAGEENDWAVRAVQSDYAAHMRLRADAGEWTGLVRAEYAFGELQQAARVDFPLAIARISDYFKSRDRYIALPDASYERIESLGEAFDIVVFCEGRYALKNAYFPGLPWNLSKGDRLLLRFTDNKTQNIGQILKRSVTLAPLGNGLFWAGANYDWNCSDELPTAAGRAFIEQELKTMLTAPFEITGHGAAIRPTVKDRRPFIGVSPLSSRYWMFNGFGTKGALLTPYWAEHLACHLLKNDPIDPETDIRRFYPV